MILQDCFGGCCALEGVLLLLWYLFHTARKKRINSLSSAFIRNTLIIIQKASIKQAKDILIFKFNKPRKFILSIVFQSLSVEMNVFQSSANSSCDSRFIHEIFSKGTGSDWSPFSNKRHRASQSRNTVCKQLFYWYCTVNKFLKMFVHHSINFHFEESNSVILHCNTQSYRHSHCEDTGCIFCTLNKVLKKKNLEKTQNFGILRKGLLCHV